MERAPALLLRPVVPSELILPSRHKRLAIFPALAALVLLFLIGCSDPITVPNESTFPETQLTFGPLDSDTVSFRVHFYWVGSDKDGEVLRYHLATDADTARPVSQWPVTTATDSTFRFLVDPVDALGRHVLMVAAEDNDGLIDPTPARRYFSSKTIPPTSHIVKGPAAFNPIVGSTFAFGWVGSDPDGSPFGTQAVVDSFQYLLLQIGTLADSSDTLAHQPLPWFDQGVYVDLINRATGDSLPAPYGDWKWTGIRSTAHTFTGIRNGEHVFAERAVDIAGAHEQTLRFNYNIRHFTVHAIPPPATPTAPVLTIRCNLFVTSLQPTYGPVDVARPTLSIFEGEVLSFSWTATASAYGGEVTGYTDAFDDTTTWPALDLLNTGVTIPPASLTPGFHRLYVRATDDLGGVTTAVIPIDVVRPAFKEPGSVRQILYVDDSTPPGTAPPGVQPPAVGSYPGDAREDSLWMEVILSSLGVPFAQWDAVDAGRESDGRQPPGARDLAGYSTVIWNTDFNNPAGQGNALWRTLLGGNYSDLAGYLRAGGTLILTGFQLAANTTNPGTTMYANRSRGICFGLEPGSVTYLLSYFPRDYMGMDGALESASGRRTQGARDFVSASPTPLATAMGVPFDEARVDTGATGSGAKWITNPLPSGNPDTNLAPGLPRVDGWNMAVDFGCQTSAGYFRVETQAEPIAAPIYTYHGVNMGVLQDGASSPREGMVCGIRTQAHDLGGTGLSSSVASDPRGALGRMVHIGFPLHFLRTPDAIALLQASFSYVNASPTLP